MIRVSLRTITRDRFDTACREAAGLKPIQDISQALNYSGTALIWSAMTAQTCALATWGLFGSGVAMYAVAHVRGIRISLSEQREARS